MEKGLKERNYGIDFLKVFSMLGIIMLHILNNGGVIDNIAINRKSYIMIDLLYTISYASVNMFAIITGFLYCERTKISKKPLINLLIITFFYSCIISVLFFVFNIKGVRYKGKKYFLYGLFPFLNGRYWYITCYIFVFVLIKYLNKFVDCLTQKDFFKFLACVFILIPVCTTVLGIVNLFLKESKYIDVFVINNGYSPFWLIYCYLIGAYIRKYKNDIVVTKKLIVLLALCIIISCLANYLTKIITFKVFSHQRLKDLFISYISPFNVVISIIYVLIFKNMKINIKFMSIISKATFGIYIIHSHYFIHDFVLKNAFITICSKNMFLIIAYCLMIDFIIFLLCLIIDIIRKKIFDIIHMDYISERIDKIL